MLHTIGILWNSDIFIQKSNSSGVVQWATEAGGIGSDRALSIATDAAGNVYITGFYFGSQLLVHSH